MKVLNQPDDSEERYECKIYLLLGYVLDEVMEVERQKDPFKYIEHLDVIGEPRLPTLLNLLKNNYTSKCLIAKALSEDPRKVQTFKENQSYVEVQNKTDPAIFERLEMYSMEDSRKDPFEVDGNSESELTEIPTVTDCQL